ncbi:inorganic phosphate transporter [Halanaeroarchaeum sulfurireducens]|uniref:Phosphate transporter n=1 Tax=Halanaeroarchaeum sulfurireducens TaxID=1604004 RepID=A0A0F7PAE6_9EURY|nr:inorganic phosphate transporter [Halanaeroarchaeum sulfurireducens]AKH96624.1 phosphate transporter [Halanaeroarchaeum sulfurireducens]ALG81026.1 phosphate transporter [Halanaeroarchaeum sulfurireducens]
MTGAGLATIVVAAAASLFTAWVIGAGSSGSTPFAPAVGANAISVMRAGFYVGILGFAGAVLQGANVSEAIGAELIHGVSLSPLAATVALTTGATLVAIGVFTGYPIATAFTITGAVVGVGLAMGGDPAWAKYRQIATLWVGVPFVGGGIAFGTARTLRDTDRVRLTVPALAALVGIVLANVRFELLGPAESSRSIAGAAAHAVAGGNPLVGAGAGVAFALAIGGIVRWDLARSVEGAQRRFLVALGSLVAFSAGGSQVGLAVGPLLPLLGDTVPLEFVLVGGGIGLLVGSWTSAPRMIKAVSQDYSSLGPNRSIAALIPSFVIAQTAVFFGIPISFNEVVVSAIVGSGLAVGSSGVSRQKMGYTVLAWVGSLAISLVVGYGAYLTAIRLL